MAIKRNALGMLVGAGFLALLLVVIVAAPVKAASDTGKGIYLLAAADKTSDDMKKAEAEPKKF